MKLTWKNEQTNKQTNKQTKSKQIWPDMITNDKIQIGFEILQGKLAAFTISIYVVFLKLLSYFYLEMHIFFHRGEREVHYIMLSCQTTMINPPLTEPFFVKRFKYQNK